MTSPFNNGHFGKLKAFLWNCKGRGCVFEETSLTTVTATNGGGGLGGIRPVGTQNRSPGAETSQTKPRCPSVHTNGTAERRLGITFRDLGRLNSRNCAVFPIAAHVLTRVDQGSSRRGCFFTGGRNITVRMVERVPLYVSSFNGVRC